MPPELADKGWQLFLTDTARFRAGNNIALANCGPFPAAEEAIAAARDLQTEFDEEAAVREEAAGETTPALPDDLAAAGWTIERSEEDGADAPVWQLVNETLDLETEWHGEVVDAFAQAEEFTREAEVNRAENGSLIPEDMLASGWQLVFDKDPKSKLPYIAKSEHLGLQTQTYRYAPDALARARELEAEHAVTAAAAANVAIEEAKRSPAAARTAAVSQAPRVPRELRPDPAVGFDEHTRTLPVEVINPEVALEMRAEGLNLLQVAEFSEAMQDGAAFPPADVFYDFQADAYWLAGGAHRHAAASDPKLGELLVTVREGNRRDAVIFAAGENKTHGLQRTNADKRLAVTALLTDREWAGLADSVIAKHAGVTQPFVSGVRQELELKSVISAQPLRKGADGVVRDVTHIGERTKDAEPDAAAESRQTTLADIAGVDLPERGEEEGEEGQRGTGQGEGAREAGSAGVSPASGSLEPDPGAGGTPAVPGDDSPDADYGKARPDWGQSPEDIVQVMNRHGGVLMRMQLEEMGFSYPAIQNAVGQGAIAQPEIGKFTLLDHKPQPSGGAETVDRRPSTVEPASAPAAKPKQKIEEILKGRMLTVSFTWIPKVPGASVSVKAGKPEDAERGMISSDDVPRFPESVLAMITRQLKGEKGPVSKTSAAATGVKKKPAPARPAARRPVAKKKGAVKKKSTTKKTAKARKR
jgi:hypothetical protein